MRKMAAWSVGTAVKNNEKAQDKVRQYYYEIAFFVLDCIN